MEETCKIIKEGKCKAPENEGVFLTKAIPEPTPEEKARCARIPSTGNFAKCDWKHWTEAHPAAVDFNATRGGLWRDWSKFWIPVAGTTQWLVEKTPTDVIRGRFLQAVFAPAARAVRFVFVLRHPVSTCKNFRSGCTKRVSGAWFDGWLAAYETMRDDLAALDAHFVMQYEWLVVDARGALGALSGFLGMPPLRFVDQTDSAPRANATAAAGAKPAAAPAPARRPRREQGAANGAKREQSRDWCVAVRPSSSDATWSRKFESELMPQLAGEEAAGLRATYETRLREFGYSIDALDPQRDDFFVRGLGPLWVRGGAADLAEPAPGHDVSAPSCQGPDGRRLGRRSGGDAF